MKQFTIPLIFIIILGIPFSQESYIDSTKIKDPSLAWKLGFIPGIGQIYNGKWVKAGLLLSAQYYALDNYNRLRNAGNISKRNTYAWWLIGLYFYGILDAYVDAQLSTFPVKKEIKEVSEFPNDSLKVSIE